MCPTIAYFSFEMAYIKLKADRIFDGRQFLQGHQLVLEGDGTIVGLQPAEDGTDAQVLQGTLMPGLVNCHCHLELSHLKNVIPPGTGLVEFLIAVVRKRSAFEDSNKLQKIREAEAEMHRNGIVAVADICNTQDAIAAKQASNITWHNLVEVLNFFDDQLPAAIKNYGAVAHAHTAHGLSAVLTPHAPYTVSPHTLVHLNRVSEGKVISMHNQETAAENELFRTGGGPFLKLYDTFLKGRNPVAPTGDTSLKSWLPYFTRGQTILLVHNTFISEEDLVFAKEHARRYGLQIVYCICPNANLYIEGRLPPIDLLLNHDARLVLGTDGYSSNGQLDIMSELRTVRKHFPQIGLPMLLQWATGNGAAAMHLDRFGDFDQGKKPGVVLLDEKELTARRLF